MVLSKNYRTILLVLTILIILLIVYSLTKILYKKPTIDIVIARYEENLDWLYRLIPDELPYKISKIYIYNKGSELTNIHLPNINIITLPNLGRESHTYFYHVINNYNNLADKTIFLPASVWSKEEKRVQLFRLLNYISIHQTSAIIGVSNPTFIDNEKNLAIDTYLVTNEENRKKNSDINLDKSELRPYGNWFNLHFPNEEISCVSYNGIMIATKNSIHKRSVGFYKILLK